MSPRVFRPRNVQTNNRHLLAKFMRLRLPDALFLAHLLLRSDCSDARSQGVDGSLSYELAESDGRVEVGVASDGKQRLWR